MVVHLGREEQEWNQRQIINQVNELIYEWKIKSINKSVKK